MSDHVDPPDAALERLEHWLLVALGPPAAG
jgi:hypothetical protein